ncbi:hypothetical protein [Mycolicibacterium psychrotolerans]|uniref:PE-PPE domain-containing protein n=1 Tax=Mycolicibacterium psychrotolerans TaxID=216929 RepID=A0A7I7M7Y0_9MYCO|nr:hypothetical protein [Mycolicibacterium psychrotolerans]BBX67479.1 hypothetical protein MPSYJ_09400 [Mycolicibacterium psychrotolerans]
MQIAVRPFVTTGVALVGASVIAVTPIAPPPEADIRVANPAVQLTAAENPFVLYSQVALDALTNISQLAGSYLEKPFPIIQAILGLPVTSPVGISQAWNDVWVSISYNLYSVVLEGLNAIYYLGNAEGPIDLLNAIIDIPAHIANGLLNGATYPDMVFCPCSGLLNPGYLGHGVPAVTGSPGFIGALIALDRTVGAAISDLFHPLSSVLAPVDEPPTPGSTTLTLKTGATPNRLIDTFIARHPAVGAAISDLFHPSSPALAPLDEPPTPGSTTLTLKTGATPNSGATPADQGPATTDVATHAQQGHDTATAATLNATSGPASARSNAATQAEQGLDTATSVITKATTVKRGGTKIEPGKVAGNGTTPSGGLTKAAKPGTRFRSTVSEAGNGFKKAANTTSKSRGNR